MKRFGGWIVLAGLLGTATAADAQMLAPYRSPYTAASDFGDPYSVLPAEPRGPRYAPMLLSTPDIYEIVRENGFSPLGIPRQRGFVYTIAVIDRGGEDGRLVIDGRSGRIIRFMPADRMGDNFHEEMTGAYGSVAPLPPVSVIRGPPRPPQPIPRVASRTPAVPTPKPSPLQQAAKPPAPAAQQSAAAVPAKPAEPQTTGQAAAPAVVEAKPAPPIAPTQEMPKAQGLE